MDRIEPKVVKGLPRTSAPTISTRSAGSSRGSARRFTLVEILIVTVIVAVMVATVVAGYSGADREQTAKVEARRLGQMLEYIRQQAVLRNEEWGIYVEIDGYSFVSYD